ncbi:MAG: hypothetical protein HZC02_02635 [Candidatus Levybacteria bacterium]|nr:hypothetical protein [Candidatus Levybacteria bacterium]
MASITRPLTEEDVNAIVVSFLEHVVQFWEIYRNNLPQLRRTMMYYSEFCYGIRFLPENSHYDMEFNPRDPLSEESLRQVFGEGYLDEMGYLIYDAWIVPESFWEGYEEPTPDTPEALMTRFPSIFPTLEDAHFHMYECPGTGFGWHEGKRMQLRPCGTPNIFFVGFTTVEEFPEQVQFLDTIRDHPRIKVGIELMNAARFEQKSRHEQELAELVEFKKHEPAALERLRAILKENPGAFDDLDKSVFSH